MWYRDGRLQGKPQLNRTGHKTALWGLKLLGTLYIWPHATQWCEGASVIMNSCWKGKHLILHHLLGCFAKAQHVVDCFSSVCLWFSVHLIYTTIFSHDGSSWSTVKYLNNHCLICHDVVQTFMVSRRWTLLTGFPVAPPRGSHVWFWVRYLDRDEIWHQHSCSPEDDSFKLLCTLMIKYLQN